VAAPELAVPIPIDLSLLLPHRRQIKRQFNGWNSISCRGNASEVGEYLKEGRAELGHCRPKSRRLATGSTPGPLFHRKLPASRPTGAIPLAIPRDHRRRDIPAAQLLSQTTANIPIGLPLACAEHGLDSSAARSSSETRPEFRAARSPISAAPSCPDPRRSADAERAPRSTAWPRAAPCTFTLRRTRANSGCHPP